MPPIRRQAILSDGCLFEITGLGLLELHVSGTGNTRTITILRDGQQIAQLQVNAVTIAKLEAAANDWLLANTDSRGTFQLHVASLDPLQLTILSMNPGESVPPLWWDSGA